MYERAQVKTLLSRLEAPRKFMQILLGPRQTGKTTLVQQTIKKITCPAHYAAAESAFGRSAEWLEQQWETARIKLKNQRTKNLLLVFDEIQKIKNWSEVVKKLWDEDTANGLGLKVVLLGSSPLLLQKGITESLAGRFEIIRVPHWSFPEMHKAFDFSLAQYLYFGGYPGAAELSSDEFRWKSYIKDSLIETTISRDILLMTRIDKPALLRRLFELGCLYSGQILSFNKMLGQLQEAGNTTTLDHYLGLLALAGLVCGIQKFSTNKLRQKNSSPKLQVLNNSLISAQLEQNFKSAQQDTALWGRLSESAVGAHLVGQEQRDTLKVYYWRELNKEVDFVLTKGDKILAIEVKSSLKKERLPGIEQFTKAFPSAKKLLIGKDGLGFKEFLSTPPTELF